MSFSVCQQLSVLVVRTHYSTVEKNAKDDDVVSSTKSIDVMIPRRLPHFPPPPPLNIFM
jgi:hypothetical protein